MSSEKEELTQDVVFDILSSARRRYVLYLLRTESGMELTDLAERVAAWENDVDVKDLEKQQRKRVYVSLYQTHIPKLADAGLVDYDKDSGMVELRSNGYRIDRHLQSDQPTLDWQYIYVPAAVAAVALVALSALDFWVFASLTTAELALVLAIGFLLSASVHALLWYQNRQGVPDDLSRK
ncbi:MAG: hypothetical protein ABEJ40_06575 [Haloarculaceae archaeon]